LNMSDGFSDGPPPDAQLSDGLKDLRNYGSFSVSQVVAYFERHGIRIAKTTIQNYVKIGLLPPADEKKRYTRQHVMLLKIITDLKRCHSLERIKALFLSRLPSLDDMAAVSGEVDAFFELYNEGFISARDILPDISEALAGQDGGGLEFMRSMQLMAVIDIWLARK